MAITIFTSLTPPPSAAGDSGLLLRLRLEPKAQGPVEEALRAYGRTWRSKDFTPQEVEAGHGRLLEALRAFEGVEQVERMAHFPTPPSRSGSVL